MRSNPFLIQRAAPSSSASLPPLFLIHDASGNILSYLKLGSLGKYRQTYGIYDPYSGTEGCSWQSVSEMARHYVRLIKKVKLRGDIVLGGWSFGGIVALQMSHILATEGRGLNCVGIVLIDTIYSPVDFSNGSGVDMAPPLAGINGQTRDQIMVALVRAQCLCATWEPPTWSGKKVPPVVLIKAQDRIQVEKSQGSNNICRLDRFRNHRQLGWEMVQSGLINKGVIDTPGNHYDIFEDEHVDATTQSLNRALSKLDDRV
ncbi:Polyketide synthase PksR [Colletotrichum chlorophyti]|uniref:Polyketide synthase PksR n=1 Tax=Colletotrichum chlorophyti TaxID=708187 RepID=A0A1Q8S458_9PEZI|nr:Polyketide synthase PksR [Colletotrichum chlorophyti]